MFDTFTPLRKLKKQAFTFRPTRFETWIEGAMVASGSTNSPIISKVIVSEGKEKVEVSFLDTKINKELAQANIFDEFISGNERLQLVTIPSETNVRSQGIMVFLMGCGATRPFKNFERNEPYCCNLFLQKGVIVKITFGFSNPVKLIEFYSDSEVKGQNNRIAHYKEYLHDGHKPIIDFFKKYGFGTNPSVLTYIGFLAAIDRCVILEQLYDDSKLDSGLNDKLVIAYVASGRKDLAEVVIKNSIKNGENPLRIVALEMELKLRLEPKRNQKERLAIYNDFLASTHKANLVEITFLNLLINFCNKHYI